MTHSRLFSSLRSLIVPLALAASPLTSWAWPTLTIPTNFLQADATLAFSQEALDALVLVDIKESPTGTASATAGQVGSYTLPVTSVTIDGLKVAAGKSTGAALRFDRFDYDAGVDRRVTLGNFRLDFIKRVIHADAFRDDGQRTPDMPVFTFNEQTPLAIKYRFPLSITAHQVLDKLFLTPQAQGLFNSGLGLPEVVQDVLKIINFGEIRVNVGVKLRAKPVPTTPYQP